MRLSVIIPSYKDPLLQKTIDSLLENSELGDGLEIIAVLDGYWPNPQLVDDKRLKILHLGKNRGMREAVNAGVAISKGRYIMKCDSHCMFGKGFDRILLERIRENWVVVPRLFKLDTEKWEVIKGYENDYNKLVVSEAGLLTSLNWPERANQRKHKMIDDTMAIQGSCWLMSRKWWDTAIKRLESENFGGIRQESTELVMKTFIAGGRTMVNKNTWYAHRHSKFGRTHHIPNDEKKKASDYILNTWKDELSKLNKYFGI